MLRAIRRLLLERRVAGLLTKMQRHGTFHCGGVGPCPLWDAYGVMLDDAWDRLDEMDRR